MKIKIFIYTILAMSTSAMASKDYTITIYPSTTAYATSHKSAEKISKCDVLHEMITGEKNAKFKLSAIIESSVDGVDLGFKSNELREYSLGYQTNRLYWSGWFSGVNADGKDHSTLFKKIYSTLKCDKYLNN